MKLFFSETQMQQKKFNCFYLLHIICIITIFILPSCSKKVESDLQTDKQVSETSSLSTENESSSIALNNNKPRTYAAGDIVLKDGTSVTASTITEEQKEDAVAVIFRATKGTSKALGIGKIHEKTGRQWCRWSDPSNHAQAYDVNIETIQCKPSSGGAGYYIFSDECDKNGADNYEQISDFLKKTPGLNDDTADAELNYPAFFYALNYGIANNLPETMKSGWYIPTLSELFEIYKANKNYGAEIERALAASGGTPFGTDFYWSSSQCVSNDYRVYDLDFNTGKYSLHDKFYRAGYTCVIREF